MDQIGFIPSKTNKILHKNRQRAKKTDEEQDFKKAWGNLPPNAGNLYLLNKFYQDNAREKKPIKSLPKNIDQNVQALAKIKQDKI